MLSTQLGTREVGQILELLLAWVCWIAI